MDKQFALVPFKNQENRRNLTSRGSSSPREDRLSRNRSLMNTTHVDPFDLVQRRDNRRGLSFEGSSSTRENRLSRNRPFRNTTFGGPSDFGRRRQEMSSFGRPNATASQAGPPTTNDASWRNAVSLTAPIHTNPSFVPPRREAAPMPLSARQASMFNCFTDPPLNVVQTVPDTISSCCIMPTSNQLLQQQLPIVQYQENIAALHPTEADEDLMRNLPETQLEFNQGVQRFGFDTPPERILTRHSEASPSPQQRPVFRLPPMESSAPASVPSSMTGPTQQASVFRLPPMQSTGSSQPTRQAASAAEREIILRQPPTVASVPASMSGSPSQNRPVFRLPPMDGRQLELPSQRNILIHAPPSRNFAEPTGAETASVASVEPATTSQQMNVFRLPPMSSQPALPARRTPAGSLEPAEASQQMNVFRLPPMNSQPALPARRTPVEPLEPAQASQQMNVFRLPPMNSQPAVPARRTPVEPLEPAQASQQMNAFRLPPMNSQPAVPARRAPVESPRPAAPHQRDSDFLMASMTDSSPDERVRRAAIHQREPVFIFSTTSDTSTDEPTTGAPVDSRRPAPVSEASSSLQEQVRLMASMWPVRVEQRLQGLGRGRYQRDFPFPRPQERPLDGSEHHALNVDELTRRLEILARLREESPSCSQD
ncbi:unnamed protein product [Caenorhabditis auriculariae]|uniref:Uncharacterized protein n=1 Tax=Caenorhabditis auriculariae TaxID=2777116 RepID=A0A8S1H0I6_9PELO|nr:unnamed protein product [Caenorhabditis auriculariae]